ncbi:MAG: glycosyltransferase [Anaerotignum sp.]
MRGRSPAPFPHLVHERRGARCWNRQRRGVSEVVRHGENGYLVAVGDDEDLARRTLEILSDRSLYESMSKKAMAWTREMFTANN